jgi:aryl-alcohol dehydrogenase-like predicted oxidoreductase
VTTKVGLPRLESSASGLPRYLYRRLLRPAVARFPRLKSGLQQEMHPKVASGAAAQSRILARDHVLRELEESLARLKRTYLDVYLVHEPGQYVLDDDLLDVFNSLVADGAIGSFGLAYGDRAHPTVRFGSVIQQRYLGFPPHVSEQYKSYLHGVVRHSVDRGKNVDVGSVVSDFLSSVPTSRFIFSASSPVRIKQVMSGIP